jgi:hypothetical protein
MSSARILQPPASAQVCVNCRAWRPWGDIGVCQETSTGYVELGRKPLGQCRAHPRPSILMLSAAIQPRGQS